MLKLQSELIVHKGNVLSFLLVVGGVMMTATAGGRCVDVAVCTFSHPANLRRLSRALVRLMGQKFQLHSAANTQLEKVSKFKPSIKKMYFTDSYNFLPLTLPDLQAALWLPAGGLPNLEPTSSNSMSVRRQGIHFILVHSWTVVTLFMGNNCSELTCYKPSNQILWLINFSCEALARGDRMFLVQTGQTGQIRRASSTSEGPQRQSLCLFPLLLLFLWMFLCHAALLAVVCLAWITQEHLRRLCRSTNTLNKDS